MDILFICSLLSLSLSCSSWFLCVLRSWNLRPLFIDLPPSHPLPLLCCTSDLFAISPYDDCCVSFSLSSANVYISRRYYLAYRHRNVGVFPLYSVAFILFQPSANHGLLNIIYTIYSSYSNLIVLHCYNLDEKKVEIIETEISVGFSVGRPFSSPHSISLFWLVFAELALSIQPIIIKLKCSCENESIKQTRKCRT